MYSNDTFGFMALGFGFIFLYLVFVIGIVTLFVMYYKNFIDAMSLVRPKNRTTGVGNVLFTMIPLVNLVYGFLVFPRISESIKNEFNTLNLPADGDFGRGLGIGYQVCVVACLIPVVNFIALIALLVFWILLWVKIHGYKLQLQQYNANGFGASSGLSNSTDILD